ncbi:MAG: GIY-YIG nuclease family protein [Clostridia bacterium]|nr:GIY-YIG nuclease family protein [Clostridia bacterium]
MYYTYMIRCTDNSLYTGMTNNLNKRMEEHFGREKEGAKYTKSHQAKMVEAVWQSKEKSLACKLEYRIKTLNKSEKESLIKGERLKKYFTGKIDCRRYTMINLEKELNNKYRKKK